MRRIACFAFTSLLFLACTTSNPVKTDSGTGDSSVLPPGTKAAKSEYCSMCSPAAMCTSAKPIDACCVCTQQPKFELERATGLVYYSAPNNDKTIDLGCLDTPKAQGAPQMITVDGYVKLFSSGNDSLGVKIEIFQEGANGALGAPVGTPVITAMSDTCLMPKPTLLMNCPVDGCCFRHFTYANVPTETPLIIKTSDASGSQKWAELYDYDIYFANGAMPYYEPSSVAATDLNTVASAAGGFTIKSDRGLLAGEVHDCADVRLSGAMVNTDVPPEGDMFYFGENESNPLPDKSRGPAGQGTSKLGLFGALNYPTGKPVRISATGLYKGQTIIVGTYTVQVFPGAVTALSLRGRRPWQK
jgi:hypothetical protein